MIDSVQSNPKAAREHAKALLESGNFAEAEQLYLRLTGEFPANRTLKISYTRAALETCRDLADPHSRRKELIRYVLDEIVFDGDETARAAALRFLAHLAAWQEGPDLLRKMARNTQTLGGMTEVFKFIPRFVERGSRGILWNRLLTRLRARQPNETEPLPATELELKLLLALESFPEFVALLDERRRDVEDSLLLPQFDRISGRLRKPRSAVFAEEKVFCIGLSRTGTTSLAEALNILGIDTAHWTNPLTQQVIAETDIFMFGGCADCCVSPEFEKLYFLYPNARFILTQRPVEEWIPSFWNHHRRVSWAGDMDSFRHAFSERTLPEAAIEFALYAQHDDLTQSYRTFEQRVRRFFSDKPDGKLLELDISAGQGWPELCRFLDHPEPEQPFPKRNAARRARTESV